MTGAFFQLIVVAVAIVALFRGFRLGLSRQVSGLLGVAFGVACAHVIGPDFEFWLRCHLPTLCNPVAVPFFFSTLSHGLIFAACVLLSSLLTGILNSAMSLLHTGILNSLSGAVFSLMKYLIFLSLLFDLSVCRTLQSPLLDCARHDDGNLAEEVMRLAPFVLGSIPSDEYAHQVQLWEASKIS